MENPKIKQDILFLLKRRFGYGHSYGAGYSSGLMNSATFVSDMLVAHGIKK